MTTHCIHCILHTVYCTIKTAYLRLHTARCPTSCYSRLSLNSDGFETCLSRNWHCKGHLQLIRHLWENAWPLICLIWKANQNYTSPKIHFKVGAFSLGFYRFPRNIPEVQSCQSEMRGAAIETITDTAIPR